jgi:hypothetical protein
MVGKVSTCGVLRQGAAVRSKAGAACAQCVLLPLAASHVPCQATVCCRCRDACVASLARRSADVWTRDVLNLGVKPDKLIALVSERCVCVYVTATHVARIAALLAD